MDITVNVQNEYDVIIRNGGTAGLVAALEAAKTGAKVLFLEESEESNTSVFKIEMLK